MGRYGVRFTRRLQVLKTVMVQSMRSTPLEGEAYDGALNGCENAAAGAGGRSPAVWFLGKSFINTENL